MKKADYVLWFILCFTLVAIFYGVHLMDVASEVRRICDVEKTVREMLVSPERVVSNTECVQWHCEHRRTTDSPWQIVPCEEN